MYCNYNRTCFFTLRVALAHSLDIIGSYGVRSKCHVDPVVCSMSIPVPVPVEFPFPAVMPGLFLFSASSSDLLIVPTEYTPSCMFDFGFTKAFLFAAAF